MRSFHFNHKIHQRFTWRQLTFHLGITISLLLVPSFSRTQQLGEMVWEELPSEHIILDYSFSEVSMLIVESTIPKLMFGSTRGIKPGSVREKEPGIWWVTLDPGVQLIDIAAANYLPLKDIRHNFQKRRVWRIKVTPLTLPIAPAGTGTIRIETDPPACYVVLNGIRLPEKTPVTLTKQPTGNHLLQIDGGFDWIPLDTTITVLKDQQNQVTIRLTQRNFAHLIITTNPPGARIFLNNKLLGISPIDDNKIIADLYTLKADLEDYYTISQPLPTKEGEITKIHLDLQPHKGSLEITAEPLGAELFIDDNSKGILESSSTLLNDVNVGTRRLTLKKSSYFDLETTVQVRQDTTTRLKLKLLPRPGKLIVESTPSGAQVDYLKGSARITSPAEIDSVEVGRYRLIAKLKGYHLQIIEGIIDPGEQESVTISLTPKTRSEAVWRSLLLPGAGQRFAERPRRGWMMTCAQVASLAFATYTYYDYQEKNNQAERAQQEYEITRWDYHRAVTAIEINTTRTRMIAALDRWNNSKNNVDQAVLLGTIAYGAAGGVYLLNALDVIFFDGGKIRFAASVSRD